MRSILIVEDEQNVRKNLEDLLESEGFSVMSAKDGVEGYEIAVEQEPDIILSDVRMPQMDGLELLQKLQENPATSTIPFIFLTAKVEQQDMREGMTIGADDYITKPFKIDDVLKAINSRLRKKENYLSIVEEFRNTLIRQVPHELRTPLVGILGFSEIIEDNIDILSKEELKDMAEKIKKSGKRLQRRVEKFLLYAELLSQDKNIVHYADESVDEYDLEPELISAQLKERAQKFGRTEDLISEFEPADIAMRGSHIEIILNELLENAFKFSRKGTPVTVSGKKGEKYFLICVSDKGAGMKSIDLDRINVFNQQGKENKTEEGLGFGLAIVKKVLEMYRGTIVIESKENDHTVVEVKIPLKKSN